MELTELENMWQDYDKKISENTRLNKEILRRLLIEKPQKRINWIKIKSALRLFSPVLFAFLLLILKAQFYISPRFFIGLGLFLPGFIVSYVWDIRYFSLISRIDFTIPVLSIKKVIAELEKYRIKTTKIRYLLMPLGMTGFLLMIIHRITFRFDFISILPLILIVFVFIASMYSTFKYSIYEPYRKLNKELSEIEELEAE